jgi:L-fuculose-phosphate aldolase
MELKVIGTVRSALAEPMEAPKQGPETGQRAVIELDPAWQPALEGFRAGQHLWVLCWFRRTKPFKMRVHPRGDPSRPLRGVLATRSPNRPNPLSLTLVRLVSLEGNRLQVAGLEAVEGTPVLDIKPWVPGIDQPQDEAK